METAAASATTHSVTAADGTKTVYDFYPGPSRHTVLVVPGFWRNREYPSMRRLGTYLQGRGFSAAIADPRGHGDSEGVYGFNTEEHEDVAAVARDLLTRHQVPRLLLLGFSAGGAVAVSTIAHHQDLPWSGLLLISSVADIREVTPRINPLTIHRHIAVSQALKRPKFSWTFRSSKPLSAVAEISDVHVPVSLIHVKNDWLVDHRHSIQLYEKANEPKELFIIDVPGNYHADRIFETLGERVYPLIDGFLERIARS